MQPSSIIRTGQSLLPQTNIQSLRTRLNEAANQESPALKKSISNSFQSFLNIQNTQSDAQRNVQNEANQFQATLVRANTTTSRIQLYTKFHSIFRPLLKFFGQTSSAEVEHQIAHLTNQKNDLEASKAQAKNYAKELKAQANDDPVIEKLRHTNKLLINSLDSALVETNKALTAAHTERIGYTEESLRRHIPDSMKKLNLQDLFFTAKENPESPASKEILKAIDKVVKEAKNSTGPSIRSRVELAAIFKDQPKIHKELTTEIFNDIETSIDKWTKSKSNMFSKDTVEQTDWLSEASQLQRLEPAKEAVKSISDSNPKKAAELLVHLETLEDAFKIDNGYKQKKTALNSEMVLSLLENSNIQTGWNEVHLTKALEKAMNDPELNTLIESIIEKHMQVGKSTPQGTLSFEELSSLTLALATARDDGNNDLDIADKKMFSTAIEVLKKIRDAQVENIISELQTADQPTSDLINKTLIVTQDVLSPHLKLEDKVFNALKDSLEDPEFFTGFTQILIQIHEDKKTTAEWLKTDGTSPLKVNFKANYLADLISDTIIVKNSKNGGLLLQYLMSTLEQKVSKVNTQLVTDVMTAPLYSSEELKNLSSNTLTRSINREIAIKANINSTTPKEEAHLIDNNFFPRPQMSNYASSSWEMERSPKNGEGNELTKFHWKGGMAVPLNSNLFALEKGSAVLDMHPLGYLSIEEQKSALSFAQRWANVLAKDERNSSSITHDVLKQAIEKKEVSLIKDLALPPSSQSLRTFLLDDKSFWDNVDQKTQLSGQTKIDFEAKNQQVLERYEKLINVSTEFQIKVEKELLRMRYSLGSEESRFVKQLN